MSRKKIIIVGLVVVVALAAVLWPRQTDELERLKADLRARGEKLTLRELAPAVASNAPDYQRRFTGAVSRLQVMPLVPSQVELRGGVTTTRAQPGWRQTVPVAASVPGNTWSNLAAQVDGSAGALRELHDLTMTWPGGLQWDPGEPAPAPMLNLVALRKAAQFLAAAVAAELHRDRLDAALTNVQMLIVLSRLSDAGGTLVEGMIGVAICGLAQAASWEALQAPGWDEARLAALQRVWQAGDLVAAHQRCVETERAWVLACFDLARASGRGMNKNMMPGVGFNSTHPAVVKINERIVEPMWRKKWSYHDEFLYLRDMQVTVEAMRSAVTNRSWQLLQPALLRLTNALAAQNAMDGFRYPMHEMAAPAFTKAARSVLRNESRRQMVLTAIAIKRWELRHHSLPERLDQLVPDWLPALPRDCMDGGTLRYRRDADGGFTLYSVGENGQDDGGVGDDVNWPKADP